MDHSLEGSMILKSTLILLVVEIIDSHRMQIALVHEDGKLIGTVTDGDIRRGILAGVPLDAPVEEIMNSNPISAHENTSIEAATRIMRERLIYQLPLVNDQGQIVGMRLLKDYWQESREDNWVVLMAGGLGTRLHPLTEDCPKALLKVGDKPIMETIITKLVAQGFARFFVCVGYKADMIKNYFGDGSKWGAEITYVHEQEPLGTAGALTLLPERPSQPIFVMNSDLLTTMNFEYLLQFHKEHKAPATMSVREYQFTVPYGVVSSKEHHLLQIDEKPVHKFFVNVGIYVLDASALDLLEPGNACDMTNLFQRMLDRNLQPAVFPLREYWIDIGQSEDFEQAKSEYLKVFS